MKSADGFHGGNDREVHSAGAHQNKGDDDFDGIQVAYKGGTDVNGDDGGSDKYDKGWTLFDSAPTKVTVTTMASKEVVEHRAMLRPRR